MFDCFPFFLRTRIPSAGWCTDAPGDRFYFCLNSFYAVCQIKLPSLQSIRLGTFTNLIVNLGRLRTKEGLPRWKIHPAEEWVLSNAMVATASTSSVHPRLCTLCSYSCVFLLVLLIIFNWLPHHCPFPELGQFNQTFSVSSCCTLIWLSEQRESETLHGTGSLRDSLKR